MISSSLLIGNQNEPSSVKLLLVMKNGSFTVILNDFVNDYYRETQILTAKDELLPIKDTAMCMM